jgi:hypothetical protein
LSLDHVQGVDQPRHGAGRGERQQRPGRREPHRTNRLAPREQRHDGGRLDEEHGDGEERAADQHGHEHAPAGLEDDRPVRIPGDR